MVLEVLLNFRVTVREIIRSVQEILVNNMDL